MVSGLRDTVAVTNAAHHGAERVSIDTQGSDVTVGCLVCNGNVTIDLDRVSELADGFEQFVRDHRNCG